MTQQIPTAESLSADAKLLDTNQSRYELVKLAAAHVGVLKRAPELSAWHVPQLIKKSLNDILAGAVKPEEIMSAHKKQLAEAERPADVIAAAQAAVNARDAESKKPAESAEEKTGNVAKKKKTKKDD